MLHRCAERIPALSVLGERVACLSVVRHEDRITELTVNQGGEVLPQEARRLSGVECKVA